jgi:hypothetical protein
MPRPRADIESEHSETTKAQANGHKAPAKKAVRQTSSNGKAAQKGKSSRQKRRWLPRLRLRMPKFHLGSTFTSGPQVREHSDEDLVEPVLTTEVTDTLLTNGNGVHQLPGPQKNEVRTPPPEQERRRFKLLRRRAKKPKPVKAPMSARGLQLLVGFLVFVVLPVGTIRGFITNSKVGTEAHLRQQSDTRTEGQLKTLGTSSDFPLAKAIVVADALAYECFTVPTALPNPNNNDPVTMQDKALANDGITTGDRVNCGWDGQGRGMLADHQVFADPYWVRNDRTTVILQLKLYQQPGLFYYYVPFKNVHGVPEIAGMPAIFGTASGAEDFMTKCPEPSDSVNTAPLRHTAQLFLDALAGAKNIDLGYLVYRNAKFGGFGPSVSSPKIMEAKYCGSKDNERRFAAMVQFNGPVKGAHYTLPYGFVLVPNPQTNGEYQVKDFGPAPGYTGE